MKKQLLCIALLTVQMASLAAQDCYSRFMQEGKNAFNLENFEKAKNSFEAARICTDRPAGDTEADQWLEKTVNGYIAAIERERKKAEENARQAERNAQVAEAGRLAILANNAMNQDSNALALALAFLAVETLPDNPDPSARQTFAEATYRHTRHIIRSEQAPLKGESIYSAAFSPDGSILMSMVGAKGILLRNTAAPFETDRLVALPTDCTAATFSPDNSIAAGGKDGVVYTIAAGGNTAHPLYQRPESQANEGKAPVSTPSVVTSIAFSPSGDRLAVGYRDGYIALLNSQGTFLAGVEGHTAPVYGLTFSPDGNLLLSRSADLSKKLWNLQLAEMAVVPGNEVYPANAFFSGENDIFIAGVDGQMALWNTQGREQRRLDNTGETVCLAEFNPQNGQIVTVSTGHKVRSWTKQGQMSGEVQLSRENIKGASLTARTDFLVTFSGTEIWLWELATKQRAMLLPAPKEGIYSAQIAPSGDRIAIVRKDGALELFETPYFALERLKTNPPVFSPEQKIRFGLK